MTNAIYTATSATLYHGKVLKKAVDTALEWVKETKFAKSHQPCAVIQTGSLAYSTSLIDELRNQPKDQLDTEQARHALLETDIDLIVLMNETKEQAILEPHENNVVRVGSFPITIHTDETNQETLNITLDVTMMSMAKFIRSVHKGKMNQVELLATIQSHQRCVLWQDENESLEPLMNTPDELIQSEQAKSMMGGVLSMMDRRRTSYDPSFFDKTNDNYEANKEAFRKHMKYNAEVIRRGMMMNDWIDGSNTRPLSHLDIVGVADSRPILVRMVKYAPFEPHFVGVAEDIAKHVEAELKEKRDRLCNDATYNPTQDEIIALRRTDLLMRLFLPHK